MELKKGHLELRFSVEFRESDVSPDKTEVEKGKFIELYSLTRDNYRETCNSPNINPISPTPKFALGTTEIIIKRISTI